jgi:hypothetical protein
MGVVKRAIVSKRADSLRQARLERGTAFILEYLQTKLKYRKGNCLYASGRKMVF